MFPLLLVFVHVKNRPVKPSYLFLGNSDGVGERREGESWVRATDPLTDIATLPTADSGLGPRLSQLFCLDHRSAGAA